MMTNVEDKRRRQVSQVENKRCSTDKGMQVTEYTYMCVSTTRLERQINDRISNYIRYFRHYRSSLLPFYLVSIQRLPFISTSPLTPLLFPNLRLARFTISSSIKISRGGREKKKKKKTQSYIRFQNKKIPRLDLYFIFSVQEKKFKEIILS